MHNKTSETQRKQQRFHSTTTKKKKPFNERIKNSLAQVTAFHSVCVCMCLHGCDELRQFSIRFSLCQQTRKCVVCKKGRENGNGNNDRSLKIIR